MHPSLFPAKRIFAGTLLFLAVFAVLSLWYIHHDTVRSAARFQRHGVIITNDVWALNRQGIRSYLELALQTDHYRYLLVRLEQQTPFLTVKAPPLTGMDRILHSLGLMPIQHFSIPLTYKNRPIGFLEGEQYRRIFYPLVNIFGFLLLLTIGILYTRNLSRTRQILRRQVEERTRKYRDSEQRFHDLINLLPEIICETDREGYLTYVNKIALKRFGLSGEEISSTSCFDLVVEDQQQRARKNFSIFLQGRELELQEFTARSADGRTFPVLMRSAPIYDGLAVCGVRSIIIDMSERASLEEKLRSAQRMETIGLMAGGVAHDLNNILSGIINYPEILLRKLPEDSDLCRPVRAIKNSGLRAAEVVNDLLTVARGAAAARVIADPNALIREYLDSPEFLQLRDRFPDIHWEVEPGEDTGNIHCSPIHVKKSIMNLLTNGAEAVPGRGTITLSTFRRPADSPDEEDQLLRKRNWVVIQVADTGPGIDPHDLEHIFEPFYTRKVMGKSGTGLGLTVVWNTLRDHDGEIRVHSDADGTVFSLYFPATEQEANVQAASSEAASYRGNGEKILVIDDDPQQRDIAMQLLDSLGYRVSTAASGEEAVEYLRTRAVHLLLLDMLMPPGMNGLETYRCILAIHPRQKAVLASGFSESGEVREAMELGAASFIKKPYVMEQLGQVVYTALHDPAHKEKQQRRHLRPQEPREKGAPEKS
jgi:PAS domain S-box-containing protein